MVQVSGPTRLSPRPRVLDCRAYEDSQLSVLKESSLVFPWVLRIVKIKGH